MIVKAIKGLFPRNARAFSTKIKHDYTSTPSWWTSPLNQWNSLGPQEVDDTRRVELRGTFIKGNYDDLPTLIFFPEACDSIYNWSAFFTNPIYQVPQSNLYLVP